MRDSDRDRTTGDANGGGRPPGGGRRAHADRAGCHRRAVLRAGAGGALGVSLAGCVDAFGIASGDGSDDELRIGVLAPDPKRNPVGRSIVRGAQLAARQLNDRGGILGENVRVIVEDSKRSPLETKRMYHKLILEDDVHLTTGVAESAALENVVEEIARQEILHFTTGASSFDVTERLLADFERNRYHFRTMFNDLMLTEVQSMFIAEMFPKFGWDSMAILAEGYRWTDDIVESRIDDFKDHPAFDLVMAERYPPEIDDFGDLYDEVEARGADVVWAAMAHTGDEALLDWRRRQPNFEFGGIHLPMQWPGYYDMIGGAAEYGITMSPATPQAEITDKTQEFITAYETEFDGDLPTYTGYTTFDAVELYAEAVETAGTFEDDPVISALESIEMTTTIGEFSFYDEDGRFPHDPGWEPGTENWPGSTFFQWQQSGGEGAQEVIWPEEYATAEYQRPPWI